MNREKQLLKNTFIIAIGQICTKFISFFLLPLYTTILTTQEYGVIDLLNTFISLLIPVFFLQIEQAVFRFLIDYRKNEKLEMKCISSVVFFSIIQTLLFSVVFLIVSLFYKNQYSFYLLINLIFSAYATILLQIARGIGKNSVYSIGSLIAGTSTILLNVLFITVFKLGVYGMLIATALGNFLCIFYLIISLKLYKFVSIKLFDINELKKLLKFSVPLIPNQLSWWIINVSDRLIVSYLITVSANGIYSAANKFSIICITMFNIFNMTWSESASLHINDKDSSAFFSRIFNNSFKLFSCLCIGVIAIMPFCFKYLIVGFEYSDAYYQIPILMIATLFNILVSLIGTIYIALKKSGEISKTSFFAAVINIVVNLILIKRIGLYAASFSTFISYFLMFIYRCCDVQKYVKLNIDKKNCCVIFILGLMAFYIYYLENKLICFIFLILFIIFSILINYKVITFFIKELKNKVNHD